MTGSSVASDLRERLVAPMAADPDFWTFSTNSRRTMGHALFNYPAMMVPQVQGALLDAWLAVEPAGGTVLDPFAGSGTVMTESMLRGLGFRGTDINPLAVLLLRVKARPLSEQILRRSFQLVLDAASDDRRKDCLDFRGRDKWFTNAVAVQLTRLHRAIRVLPGTDVRRFFWVCLAAAVRQVSNSRTSTFKLHVYDQAVLAARTVDALSEFKRIAADNIAAASVERAALAKAELLRTDGRYKAGVDCQLADVRQLSLSMNRADVLMTSPPYGDNRTTVPYGQYAYLPLRWIDPGDLDGEEQLERLIGSPYRTDVASLGGRAPSNLAERLKGLTECSDSVRATAKVLADLPGNGLRRFATFVCDLDEAMEKINDQLRPKAFQFWTLGERSISGHRVPTTRIVAELAASRGLAEVVTLARSIPNGRKRMAIRNDSVATIGTESILVLQGNAASAAAQS